MVEETIYFKIVSNKNENVYTEGFVNINDEEAVDVDWHYWTGNGYQNSPFYHHDQEKITGLTDEQNAEIDEFIDDYRDDALWIDNCILQCSDDDDLTYVRENCTLIINDGAKIEEKNNTYYFNNQIIDFDHDLILSIANDIEEYGEANALDIVASHYAQQLTRNLGVWTKYGDLIEQALDNTYDNDWLLKLSQLTDENLDDFLKNEGIIDEELDY